MDQQTVTISDEVFPIVSREDMVRRLYDAGQRYRRVGRDVMSRAEPAPVLATEEGRTAAQGLLVVAREWQEEARRRVRALGAGN